jgi:hypothetical protein
MQSGRRLIRSGSSSSLPAAVMAGIGFAEAVVAILGKKGSGLAHAMIHFQLPLVTVVAQIFFINTIT